MTISMRQPAQLALYGLTQEDFAQLLWLQERRCAACRKKFSRLRPPCIDHDHRTGETCGLLCPPCNFEVLGSRRRDPEFYLRVAAYLMDPPARQLDGPTRRHRDAPPTHTG